MQTDPCETVGPAATRATASVKGLRQQSVSTTAAARLHTHETQPSLQQRGTLSQLLTDSCQQDINRVQLQKRLDTEIPLCAVNKRPALLRC